MAIPARSKNMAMPPPFLPMAALDLADGKWSGSTMTHRPFPLTRRTILAAIGGAMASPNLPATAAPAPRRELALTAEPGSVALRPGSANTPVWSLLSAKPDSVLRFKRGEELGVTLENRLPIPLALSWYGVDGVAGAEPLAQPAVASGARQTFDMALRQAGTFLCDLRLLGDGQARPLPIRPLVVAESEPVAVDRDELLLIEDWRLRPDASAVAPGSEARDATVLYTVNGGAAPDIRLRANERLRLRIINGCQRNVIALKFEDHAVLVMAIDGQPAEPFPARDGQLVLAPGTRIDAFIDGLRPPGSISAIILHDGRQPHPVARLVMAGDTPQRVALLPAATALPSNGLPAQLELRNALRFELALVRAANGTPPDWSVPGSLTAASAPAFRAKAGRTVVLALTNRASIPAVFHLHGHHFRLLDRLDDGWKPFWLDTLLIDAGQTQRVAFAAEYRGRWLMEAMATDWAAPRLARWYMVE
jgi:FtsP/CotA-like multicopper oxidase with cupredoxin domain